MAMRRGEIEKLQPGDRVVRNYSGQPGDPETVIEIVQRGLDVNGHAWVLFYCERGVGAKMSGSAKEGERFFTVAYPPGTGRDGENAACDDNAGFERDVVRMVYEDDLARLAETVGLASVPWTQLSPEMRSNFRLRFVKDASPSPQEYGAPVLAFDDPADFSGFLWKRRHAIDPAMIGGLT